MSELKGIKDIVAHMREKAMEAVKRDLEHKLIYGESFVKATWEPPHEQDALRYIMREKKTREQQLEAARRQTLERPGIVPIIYGSPKPTPCEHEYVNVSFAHIRMVCKHCNQEQP